MAGLVAVGVRIDAWDTDGGTALHRATLREDATMIDFLLDPVHPWNAIIFLRNERIIKILLNHGLTLIRRGQMGFQNFPRQYPIVTKNT
jgi:hypothetical protein